MSVQAENRFAKVSKSYFDLLLNSPAVRRRQEASALENQVDFLREKLRTPEAELARAKSCIERRRVYLTVANKQVEEARTEAETWRKETLRWVKAFGVKDRAWRFVSRIVRDLCAPEEVAKWREEQAKGESR